MKRKVALLLSIALVATALPMHTDAAGAAAPEAAIAAKASASLATAGEPTTEGLEKAIREVKARINVPSAYTDFNYYFNDSGVYSSASWSLSWSNPKDNSYLQVNCDADYHITSFYQYDNSKENAGVAKYLRSELKDKADAFIKKIAPETNGKLEYLNSNYDGIYGGNYIYNYQRVGNNVDFPDNGVTVYVSSVTGEPTSANINWLYDASVPAATAKITKEEAARLIKENMEMKLVYRSNYFRTFKQDGTSEVKAFLVYEPSENYISVDANTGKIYLTKSEWITQNDAVATKESANFAGAADMGAGSTEQALTEAEIKQISELKNIISKSKAISIITENDSLYLEDSLKSITASLNKQWGTKGENSYVWNISLSDPEPTTKSKGDGSYRAYAYASVDAVSGQILSFYSSMKGYYNDATQSWKNVTVKYDKKKSQAILEKFLAQQASVRFKNSVLSTVNDELVVGYQKDNTPIYGGYSYQYNRTNENVEYPNNYLYGSVDGVTGKIYSYGANWDDNVVFESAKGVITPAQAMDYYLGNEDYGLKYEIYSTNKDSSGKQGSAAYSIGYGVRLVYRPDLSPAYISPFTGGQLDYNGKPYTGAQAYTYSDITDSAENRNILLLADMNIGFEGGKFNPDQTITVAEINKLFSDMGYGDEKLIESSGEGKQLITKEELANLFIVKLGLEKMSKLQGIYKTGYLDDNSITSKYYGAVALAKGYGLMDAEADGNFNPKANLTRIQAVDFLMNFINVQKKGIFY
ncbi:MAG TPA: hypothetical protein GXX75_18595 [Clostridiales bacterium]|nr:hypothetical protein [Clostridiales bacterium]